MMVTCLPFSSIFSSGTVVVNPIFILTPPPAVAYVVKYAMALPTVRERSERSLQPPEPVVSYVAFSFGIPPFISLQQYHTNRYHLIQNG